MSPLPSLASSFLDITPVLHIRQTTTTIATGNEPTTSTRCSGQYSGGTLAGAIIGTFFGTLLVLYLFNSIQQQGKGRSETVVVERKVRSNGTRRRHRSRDSNASSVRRPSRVYSTRSS